MRCNNAKMDYQNFDATVKVGGQMQQHKKWFIEILMLNVKL
jgi:hypothetical protein